MKQVRRRLALATGALVCVVGASVALIVHHARTNGPEMAIWIEQVDLESGLMTVTLSNATGVDYETSGGRIGMAMERGLELGKEVASARPSKEIIHWPAPDTFTRLRSGGSKRFAVRIEEHPELARVVHAAAGQTVAYVVESRIPMAWAQAQECDYVRIRGRGTVTVKK